MFFRISRSSIIILSCLIIYSCTLLKTTPETINNDIDKWLANNQFNKINYALKNLDQSNPEYDAILKRKPSIESRKKAYIKSISVTANKLKKKNLWEKAIDTYTTALANIDDAPHLINERNSLIKERDDKINQLRKELLIKHAKSLVTYKKIYLQLNQLVPDDYDAQFDINIYEKDKKKISLHLEKCAELANDKKQFSLAIECFSLSHELYPTRHKLAHINELETTLKKHEIQQRYTELLSAYKAAYSKKQYSKARTHLTTLLKISPNHKKANQYLAELDAELENKIQDMLASGKYLYSQNKINEALDIWKQAQKIEPKNEELQQLIYRTEKVSKKIESLEHNQ